MSTTEFPCPICHAKPGGDCVNTLNPDRSLPGRKVHFARLLPPDSRKDAQEDGADSPSGDSEPPVRKYPQRVSRGAAAAARRRMEERRKEREQ